MIPPIHPFPARMAPDLAVAELESLGGGRIVLDPMAGSGTVLRQATQLGHRAIGFDLDPLAVLMASVWTTPVEDSAVEHLAAELLKEARTAKLELISLPWIDNDDETRNFVNFWFAEPQLSDLRRISYALNRSEQYLTVKGQLALDVLRLALSRIIITKDRGASLARDVSHSRPHKVTASSDFDVMTAFDRSVQRLRHLLRSSPPPGNAEVTLGDARSLQSVGNRTIDVVLTSPPYLNAIDYMRGHRLALVWLGHSIGELRKIRSTAIGAERGPNDPRSVMLFEEIQAAMGATIGLSPRQRAMISRYAEDIYRFMSEIARVLKSEGRAILVVGNSCLKDVFVTNSDGVVQAGRMVGLQLLRQSVRELPSTSRYLPMPSTADKPLGKRMRTETIMTFAPG